jgi:predicted CXXCH cytochrome family protein
MKTRSWLIFPSLLVPFIFLWPADATQTTLSGSPPSGFEESIHARRGLTCRHCHPDAGGPTGDAVCAPCHQEVFTLYKGTPHGMMKAAKCTDCHPPHGIKSYTELSAQERIAKCTRCHGDHADRHRWLPNTALHFLHLECTSCHSPDSRKGMIFEFVRRTATGKERLRHEDLMVLFVEAAHPKASIDRDGDGIVSSQELSDFFVRLRRTAGKGVSIEGAILVTGVHHDFTATRHREKECATCHSRKAPFYDSMYLLLPSAEGGELVQVEDTVLSALPLSLSINLILLGEEKIRYSDLRRLLFSGPEGRAELLRELGLRWIDFVGLGLASLLIGLFSLHAILRWVIRP